MLSLYWNSKSSWIHVEKNPSFKLSFQQIASETARISFISTLKAHWLSTITAEIPYFNLPIHVISPSADIDCILIAA